MNEQLQKHLSSIRANLEDLQWEKDEIALVLSIAEVMYLRAREDFVKDN